MARRPGPLTRLTIAVVCLFGVAAQIGFTASSQFNQSAASATNVAGTAYVAHDFSLVPGTATQQGTATPIASGSGMGIAFDVGRVTDSHTFTDVVRVTNIDSATHSLDLSLVGSLAGLSGLEFSDGTTSKTFAPGATNQLRVRTTATHAGSFSGSARFAEDGEAFMRLDAPIGVAQAPLPASGLTIAAPDGTAHASLNWTASTATGVAGYNVYRAPSSGGTYTKINGSTIAGTAYNDTSVALGGNYWYSVRAVASGVSPMLDGLDSNIANTAVLTKPTSVSVPAGGSNYAGYVTAATASSATVNVVVPSGTGAGDTVSVTATQGAGNVTGTATASGGAQTVSITGMNLSAMADGAITLTAKITRGAFNSPTTAGSATKDTVIPAAPTGASIPGTATNPANYVNASTASAAGVSVASSAGATDTIQAQLTSGAVNASGTVAGGSSPKTVSVNASSLADTAVGGLVIKARVIDVAGNASAWFTGTAGTKDTVFPNAPNFGNVQYTEIWFIFILSTNIAGNNGAIGAGDQVYITDYSNSNTYGWLTANGSGNFGSTSLANNGTPRKLGYDVRDTAWNQNARVCRNYNNNGTGSNTGC